MPPQSHIQSAKSLSQPKSKGELIGLPAAPSFALDDASTILEIEVRADQLLNYIDKLTSFADRACSAALRQNETAHRIEESRFTEMIDLRRTLERQNEKLHEQQLALVRLEQQSKAQIAALEARLRQNDMQQAGEKKQDLSPGDNAGRIPRVKEAEALVRGRGQDCINPLDEELANLKLELAERDKTIQTKNALIQQLETESRVKIQEIEQRLRDAERNLQSHEATLKAKETLIQATALKEAEMGNLIKRLSAECDSLSNQLQKTPQSLSQEHGNPTALRTDTKIWRRVVGRFQEDPQ